MNLQPSRSVGSVILDEVLDAIAAALTTHAPERGGLLFGPRGQKLVTLFVADLEAEHHSVTYTPSAGICRRSPEIERESGLEYKGIIHSHPGAMDHPSKPDIRNACNALQTNPHLSYFLMPIVTLGNFTPSDLDSHELLLPGGKLSHWLVPQAVTAQGRRLSKERISSITLWSDLKAVAASLPGRPKVERSFMLDIEGVSAAAYMLIAEGGAWLFAAAPGYPFTPPLVVPPAGERTAVPLAWDLAVPADKRFRAAISPLLGCSSEIPPEPPDDGMTPICSPIHSWKSIATRLTPWPKGLTTWPQAITPWSRAILLIVAVCFSGMIGRHYPVSKNPAPECAPARRVMDKPTNAHSPTHDISLDVPSKAVSNDFMII